MVVPKGYLNDPKYFDLFCLTCFNCTFKSQYILERLSNFGASFGSPKIQLAFSILLSKGHFYSPDNKGIIISDVASDKIRKFEGSDIHRNDLLEHLTGTIEYFDGQ